jgi:hypothetical protein
MKKEKNQIVFLVLFALATVFLLNINLISAGTDSCNPTIKLVSQDPNPAVPNDYVKVVFEITDLGDCEGFSVKLNPEYPFSIDSNESLIQTIESVPFTEDSRTVWMISYKLRVDPDAFDGDYNLKLQYKSGSSQNFAFYIENKFNVTIQDSRTSFDAVIQETSGSDVSIAIANIGKYTANSVVVRIPEQDSFTASGTDGQMVGNLESGDYTIVGFTISSKATTPQQNMNKSRTDIPTTPSTASDTKLKFDIYYTDDLGERRVVNMELPLSMAMNSSITGMGGEFGPRGTASTSSLSKWYKWIIIIVILVIVFLVCKKYSQQIKNGYSKIVSKDKKGSSNTAPDWVKNARSKEKNK